MYVTYFLAEIDAFSNCCGNPQHAQSNISNNTARTKPAVTLIKSPFAILPSDAESNVNDRWRSGIRPSSRPGTEILRKWAHKHAVQRRGRYRWQRFVLHHKNCQQRRPPQYVRQYRGSTGQHQSLHEGPEDTPTEDELSINDYLENVAAGDGDNGVAGALLATTTGRDALLDIPRGQSKAHHLLEGNKLFFFLPGPRDRQGELWDYPALCWKCQGRDQEGRKDYNQGNILNDTAVGWSIPQRELHGETIFNEYVNPQEDAEWNTAGDVHSLSVSHPNIVFVRGINNVWQSFALFVEKSLLAKEEVCVVAYYGAVSTMK